jgi:hypothetical protein
MVVSGDDGNVSKDLHNSQRKYRNTTPSSMASNCTMELQKVAVAVSWRYVEVLKLNVASCLVPSPASIPYRSLPRNKL